MNDSTLNDIRAAIDDAVKATRKQPTAIVIKAGSAEAALGESLSQCTGVPVYVWRHLPIAGESYMLFHPSDLIEGYERWCK